MAEDNVHLHLMVLVLMHLQVLPLEDLLFKDLLDCTLCNEKSIKYILLKSTLFCSQKIRMYLHTQVRVRRDH